MEAGRCAIGFGSTTRVIEFFPLLLPILHKSLRKLSLTSVSSTIRSISFFPQERVAEFTTKNFKSPSFSFCWKPKLQVKNMTTLICRHRYFYECDNIKFAHCFQMFHLKMLVLQRQLLFFLYVLLLACLKLFERLTNTTLIVRFRKTNVYRINRQLREKYASILYCYIIIGRFPQFVWLSESSTHPIR